MDERVRAKLDRTALEHRRNIQKVDIVLVVDPNTPRGTLPVGRIIETNPGPDGVVKVRTRTGVYTRPVGKLCLT